MFLSSAITIVVEKILNLFAWLFYVIRFEQGDGILFVQSFWLAVFLESLENWNFDRIEKKRIRSH